MIWVIGVGIVVVAIIAWFWTYYIEPKDSTGPR